MSKHYSERWLTPDRKAQILEAFNETRTLPYGCGIGGPDEDVLPFCDRLNLIQPIVTLQSCAGHVRPSGYVDMAHVWIWMDSKMTRLFDQVAIGLVANNSEVERVAKIYSSWGQEFFEIMFQGNELGLLDNSTLIIYAYLESVYDMYKRDINEKRTKHMRSL